MLNGQVLKCHTADTYPVMCVYVTASTASGAYLCSERRGDPGLSRRVWSVLSSNLFTGKANELESLTVTRARSPSPQCGIASLVSPHLSSPSSSPLPGVLPGCLPDGQRALRRGSRVPPTTASPLLPAHQGHDPGWSPLAWLHVPEPAG